MKEISFWKTQWVSILVSIIDFIIAIILFVYGTIIKTDLSLYIIAVLWFISGAVWATSALINYNNMCISRLQERIIYLEAFAITDIDEESPNHYVVKRRLGPDNED